MGCRGKTPALQIPISHPLPQAAEPLEGTAGQEQEHGSRRQVEIADGKAACDRHGVLVGALDRGLPRGIVVHIGNMPLVQGVLHGQSGLTHTLHPFTEDTGLLLLLHEAEHIVGAIGGRLVLAGGLVVPRRGGISGCGIPVAVYIYVLIFHDFNPQIGV